MKKSSYNDILKRRKNIKSNGEDRYIAVLKLYSREGSKKCIGRCYRDLVDRNRGI